jgi:type IX secretion system PorP/SprF family membrane protein
LFYRNQWAGFDGAPKTQSLSVHSPIFDGGFGAGLNVLHDQIGINDDYIFRANMSYKLRMRTGHLFFGLSGAYHMYQSNWSAVSPGEEGDQELPYGDVKEGLPNFGFGVFYQHSEAFIGLSIPVLLENGVLVNQPEGGIATVVDNVRHYYLTGGYLFKINENVKIRPQAMLRYVEHAPFQVDANISALFNDVLWVGVGYRLGDSVDLMLQYNISPQFNIGYAYDFTLSKLQNHGGSHEIFIGFDLWRKSDGYDHPRYF